MMMEKRKKIKIGDVVFLVKEDDYLRLQNYLNAIKVYASNSGKKEKVVMDIESKIARILKDKNTGMITTAQVDEVLSDNEIGHKNS